MRSSALILLTLLTAFGAPGCRVGGPSKTDPLVIEVVSLRTKVAELELENAELKNKVARASALAGQSAEVGLAAPELASLEVDRYTGWLNSQPDRDEILRVYITAADARRRAVQITGWLHVEAKSAESSVIAARTLTPSELRDAYQGGFMGPVYVVDLPAPRPSGSAIVSAALLSMPSGEPLARAERTIEREQSAFEATGSMPEQ